MSHSTLYEHVKNALVHSEYVSSEGEFLSGKIFEAIESLETPFISLLLKNKATKEHFFNSIDDAVVLDQNKLFDFFNAKEYFDNSYTSYTNKIGLIRKDSFIKKFDDTVLAWPYKDCILEGGMSSEDAGKKEVFYNTIISKDEIDRLFEPKVLTNIKKYSRHSELDSESKEGLRIESAMTIDEITIEDNLILKGNNLLALHSLKKRYIDQNGGKIKLIYIDPPYNTGNDGFRYNDRFNHSTWLTFMKNRLEVARELLRDDGVIFVSIDDREQAYLKVLMDEIFKKENFIANINRTQQKGKNKGTFFNIENDYILVYAKKVETVKINKLKKTTNISQYPLFDKIGNFKRRPFEMQGTDVHLGNRKNLGYSIYVNQISQDIITKIDYDLLSKDIYLAPDPKLIADGYVCFRPRKSAKGNGIWRWESKSLIEKKSEIDFDFTQKRVYLKDRFYGEIEILPSTNIEILNTNGTKDLENLFDEKVFDYPKPVALIKHLIQIGASESDIILDFHAGSGTTAHAVLDLNKEDGGNRKFILIEQMDYIETVTAERVKKVIEKNGKGSFVYAKLKVIDDFQDADTIGRLNDNMRYLPIGEIDDENYCVSDEEKRLNKQFYGIV